VRHAELRLDREQAALVVLDQLSLGGGALESCPIAVDGDHLARGVTLEEGAGVIPLCAGRRPEGGGLPSAFIPSSRMRLLFFCPSFSN